MNDACMNDACMNGTIVRGQWVLTMGSEGDVRDGAVLFDAGVIAAVGPYEALRAQAPGLPVVGDGTGIVVPGLVNAHTHLSEALVTGMGSQLTLFEWGARLVGPVGSHLSAQDAEEGTALKAVELLLSGVTTVNDMFCHANPGSLASLGVVRGLERAGLRGIVSYGAENTAEGAAACVPGLTARAVLEEHLALEKACAASELVGFRYGIGTLLGQTDELLEAGAAACREHGWAIHTHVAEVREEIVSASLRWGRRSVEHARVLGLLDVPLIAGHGIWLTEPDVACLAEHGVAIAHNPVANMILGSGVCPVPRLRSAGIAVAVGTDGCASNDSQNMLEAIKFAALLQKVHSLDPAVIGARDVLAMATIDGARALGLDHLVGSLEVGKRADVVLLQGSVETAVLHDPVEQLVYATSPRSVSDVWVDGRHLVGDHRVVTIDEGEQIERCRPLARALAERAGLAAAGMSRL